LFAHTHASGIRYGLEANGDPIPGFHNHVLHIMIKDEDVNFFTTKNGGEDSLVELVDQAGDVIIITAVAPRGVSIEKKLTAFYFVPHFEQNSTSLNALFAGLLGAPNNNAKWNGNILNQKVMALNPSTLSPPVTATGNLSG
jgi:hypothetical protein